MDTSQYLDIFVDETKEHIQVLSDQIMVLEKEPDNSDAIAEIFRSAHSLKGMAGTMGFKRMQRLTHDMENVFSAVREGKMKVNDSLVDTLFRGLDAIQEYLDLIQETIAKLKASHPELLVDGELQLDAAINPRIGQKKAPDSPVAGFANTLIVPDLNTGNILYKAMEQFGGFTAAGPILQGFNAPISDLSRGSTEEDVLKVIEYMLLLAKH